MLALLAASALGLQGPLPSTPFPRQSLSPSTVGEEEDYAPDWAAYGYPLFGSAVSRAGDVDQDGRPDFLVANPGLYGDHGIVWVVSGRDGKSLHRIESAETGDGFGHDLQTAGDVNADGHPDWIVGSLVEKTAGGHPLHPSDPDGPRPEFYRGIQRRSPGYALVHSGKTGERLLFLEGEKRGDLFGYAVCGGGDINADGHADLLVSAPRAVNGAGRIYVFSGKDGALLRRVDGSSSREHLGEDLCNAGDLDGDGTDDHAVARQGGVAFSGKTGAVLWSAERGAHSGDYEVRLGTGGDINRDGKSDLLISYAGGVEILSGPDGAVLRRFEGIWAEAYGGGVDVLTDADKSSSIDLVVGQPRTGAGEGSVLVIDLGQPGSVHAIETPDDLMYFGRSIACLGDLDGDGASDFIVGADNSRSHYPGGACVYSGRTRKLLMEIGRSGEQAVKVR